MKKFLAICTILAMTIMTASATETTKQKIELKPQTEKKMQMEEKKMPPEEKKQMDEKRQQMEEKIKTMMDKWNKLTDAQKNEIYAITDQIALLNKDIVDKLSDFKLIDDNTAKDISNKINEKQKMLKENKKLPMLKFAR